MMKKISSWKIRAGAGGDEAAIFAAELFRMYSRYAQNRRWNVDVISSSEKYRRGHQGNYFRNQRQRRFQPS